MAFGLKTGSHEEYRWLTTSRENMNTFLRLCPELVLGKYVAITCYDSGVFKLTEQDIAAGWESRKGIAYSRRIGALSELPETSRFEPAELYQEWYVFKEPTELGPVYNENIFVTSPAPDNTFLFVNYGGFVLHDQEEHTISDLFWKQIAVYEPESYFAEGLDYTTFLTREPELFEAVLEIIESCPDSKQVG